MDEARDVLVDERDALADRVDRVLDAASKYKKIHTESQDKLRRSVERIGEIQVKLRREKANVADENQNGHGFEAFCWIATPCSLNCASSCRN